MKSSRKRQEEGEEDEEEEQQQTTADTNKAAAEGGEANPEAAAAWTQDEDQRDQEEEEEEDDEEPPAAAPAEEAPKLEEGFFEIEAIRRRRVRKGQLQYLIKWRGWPESANTWEPLENLRSCSDVVDAFEERLEKSTRKRKRRLAGPYSSSALKSLRESSSSEPCAEMRNAEGPDSGNGLVGEEAGGADNKSGDVQPNGVGGGEDGGEKKDDGNGGRISIQLNGGPREEDALVEDGASKVESVQPLQGAKKRKAGCVRRFKQDAVQPQGGQEGKGEKLGGEDVDSTEDDNGERHRVDEDGKPPYIVKILKPVKYHASVTNDVQQVSIKFKALRSDGQEVLVDDKDLKANNPLLLISFYEQHLRYNPPTCDSSEQHLRLDRPTCDVATEQQN